MERSVRRVSFAASTPSGKTRISPDEMTLRRFPSSQTHDPPDGKPLRLARQNHFGSQCATGSVYWHLPAKVRLKKSHFGKPPLTECVLRHPPCQSELAEASTTFCGPFREQAIHPEGNAHPRLSGGNHFVRNGKARPRGVFCCERPIRQNPHFAGQNSFESTISVLSRLDKPRRVNKYQ